MTFTDKTYPNPHPEFTALEWAYPEAWPPQQIIVAMALQRYGNQKQARDVSRRYIGNFTTWEKTACFGSGTTRLTADTWFLLNDTNLDRFHGFTSASAVVVGRVAFS